MSDSDLGGTPDWLDRLRNGAELHGIHYEDCDNPEAHWACGCKAVEDTYAAVTTLAAAAPSPQEGGGGTDDEYEHLRDTVDEALRAAGVEPADYEEPDAAEPVTFANAIRVLGERARLGMLPLGCVGAAGCRDRDEDDPGGHDPACRPAPPPAGVQVDREAVIARVEAVLREQEAEAERLLVLRDGRFRGGPREAEFERAANAILTVVRAIRPALAPLLGSPGETR